MAEELQTGVTDRCHVSMVCFPGVAEYQEIHSKERLTAATPESTAPAMLRELNSMYLQIQADTEVLWHQVYSRGASCC